jgi:uncharacterized GH25 family protein
MRSFRLRLALATSLILRAAAPLFAHDFWLEPSTFSPQSGQIIGVKLRVGQDLLGDPVPRMAALVNQFVFEDGGGRKPLIGREGADPAGLLRVADPGLLVVGYFSNPSAVDLPAEKFNQSLRDEGLDEIVALRARRNQTGATGHEVFLRCAKSLLLSGPPNRLQRDRQLGFPLELVAERNPYTMHPGEDLAIRLTFENAPLAGALVTAINRLNPAEKQTGRTDSAGRVRLRLAQGGMWLVKAVHMIPAPAGTNAEWKSFWASLTFELPTIVTGD